MKGKEATMPKAPQKAGFAKLMCDIRNCTLCKAYLPLGPRPVLQAHPKAKIRIIGQAPGKKVHESGIPWDDRSGDRLREWLGIDKTVFYDPEKIVLLPIGFCYPGRGSSGDMSPRPECAPQWHGVLNAHLTQVRLTLLVGSYAQKFYLGDKRKDTLGDTVRAWREYLPHGYLPLVHPSPRNQIWLRKNPWFETELLPPLRRAVKKTLGTGE